MDAVDVRPQPVHAAQHQRRGDVTLVLEQHLRQHLERGAERSLAARVERVQLQVGGDQLGGLLGVGRGAGAAAVHVGRQVVDLLAVKRGHRAAVGGARVGSQDDAVLEDDAADGGARLHRLGQRGAGRLQRRISDSRDQGRYRS